MTSGPKGSVAFDRPIRLLRPPARIMPAVLGAEEVCMAVFVILWNWSH
jgi:hypothetical protein